MVRPQADARGHLMATTVVTFIGEVAPHQQAALTAAVEAFAKRVASSGQAPFSLIPALHFASIVVFAVDGERPALLVLESNFDGPLDPYVDALVAVGAADIDSMFRCCVDYNVNSPADQAAIGDYLHRHVQRPNAWHVGNFGRSAPRIAREATLYNGMAAALDRALLMSAAPSSSNAATGLITNTLASMPNTGWVGAPNGEPTAWERNGPTVRLALAIAGLLLIAAGLTVLTRGWALILIPAYLIALRWHELNDKPQDRVSLTLAQVRALTVREDLNVQNHLASLTTIKPGLFRILTLRAVLWAANLAARTSIHGTLSGIPSIHFAHWSIVNHGRHLLFLSNYDGSWESYLDDFIDQASVGLTGIWTNTVGFPRTLFLVLEGARDGVAFKTFARSHQTPTAVWYSAYPSLTVQRIDTNTQLRDGLRIPPAGAAVETWIHQW